jgi:stage V sporulation protein B
LYFLSPFAVRLLFNGLSAPEKSVVIKLLKLGSPCIVLLSFLQTSNAVLIGKGKLYLPVFTLGVGIIIKTVLNLILLKNPQINIYGGQIAVIACYFTVSLLNLLLVARSK